jgi:large subunit ribosomal protein L23
MIKPIFTEKSLRLAKGGKYTFRVDVGMAKDKVKSEISRIFGVHVVDIWTLNTGGESGRSVKGRKFVSLRSKKAIVVLKDKEKIDLFEEGKK